MTELEAKTSWGWARAGAGAGAGAGAQLGTNPRWVLGRENRFGRSDKGLSSS